MQHLADLGHTRIGHVTGQSRNTAPNERLVGFREAMNALGLPLRDEWIIPGDYSMESGMAAADRIAALTERPTAMFLGNDESAIGFISRMREHGIECPRDISVIGFDDITVSSRYSPPLTTMRQPREEIGRIAIEAVIDIIEGRRDTPQPLHVVLRFEQGEQEMPHRRFMVPRSGVSLRLVERLKVVEADGAYILEGELPPRAARVEIHDLPRLDALNGAVRLGDGRAGKRD